MDITTKNGGSYKDTLKATIQAASKMISKNKDMARVQALIEAQKKITVRVNQENT